MKILFLMVLLGCVKPTETQHDRPIHTANRWPPSILSQQCLASNGTAVIAQGEKAASNIQIHTSFGMLLLSAIVLAIALIRERRHKHRLQELAHIDHLTSLYNRRYLYRLGKRLLNRSNNGAGSFAAIMLDVDHFKRINDVYGHSTGDQVLVQIAKVCSEECRPSDIVGRFGGEEFLLLLPNTLLSEAVTVAERIRVKISDIKIDSNKYSAQNQEISASLGLCCSDQEANLDFDQLIKLADEAMYLAKAAGRNCVQSKRP
ncbi:GGDEF domain-containing protein [uncultured Pseudoteredinibacter sp.]|uniref:GGDEF domain-containing protein n=1 Tax=uncultured Pseudoteredinibacter sp. TaxID=1641701 RepID=UPI0026048FEC|nr:GGDEF domain-containing protein [uncultured Pseudoteredinibacter sp.]